MGIESSARPSDKVIRDIHRDVNALTFLQNERTIDPDWDETERKRVRAKAKPYVWRDEKVWYKKPADPSKLFYVPPIEERERWIEWFHSLGHFGQEKTNSLVGNDLWWYGMGEDVRAWVRQCDVCLLGKGTFPTPTELAAVPVEKPWRRVYMDICSMPESKKGNKCCLVAIDHFTKWPEVVAAPTFTSKMVYDFVEQSIICRYGCLVVIHVDADSQFEGALPPLLAAWGIYREKGMRENPKANGLVERFIQTLKGSLHRCGAVNPYFWEDDIPLVLLGYRTSVHASTRFSPFYLNYGRHPTLIGQTFESLVPRMIGQTEAEDLTLGHDLAARAGYIRTALEKARQNNDRAQERQAADFAKRRNPSGTAMEGQAEVQKGDWVALQPATRHKTTPATGLYCVLDVTGDRATILSADRRPSKHPLSTLQVVVSGQGIVSTDMLEAYLQWNRTEGKKAATATNQPDREADVQEVMAEDEDGDGQEERAEHAS